MIENARGAMEGAMENLSARRPSVSNGSVDGALRRSGKGGSGVAVEKDDVPDGRYGGGVNQIDIEPKLNLTQEQFSMIDSLDKVGFKKYRVHISKVRHTHAAIIVRMKRKGFEEGKVVLRHWLDEEFEI